MLYTSTYSCYQSFIGTLACLNFSQTIISSNHPSKIHDPTDWNHSRAYDLIYKKNMAPWSKEYGKKEMIKQFWGNSFFDFCLALASCTLIETEIWNDAFFLLFIYLLGSLLKLYIMLYDVNFNSITRFAKCEPCFVAYSHYICILNPHANGRNVVGQQLPTFLDATCCVPLHTLCMLLYVFACC